ncbi:TPA: LysR family transcriptional regulator [Enterobacter cloacae]
MDKLNSMQVFVHVVDTHSFARASEILGLPRSTVSRVIKDMETYLGLQLLQRTTRKLSVTADGRRYYEECKRILADIATIESSFPGRAGQPKGRFKVGMPQTLARYSFIPRIYEFLDLYPELDMILCSSDNIEDLVQEGYDCVIRTGRIEDSTSLVARPLAKFKWAVMASPKYIEAHGKPESLNDLERHGAVGFLNHRTGRTTDWLFSLDGEDRMIRMKENFVVDDTDAYIQAGIAGIGLIWVASYLVVPFIKNGALIPCLNDCSYDLPLSLVYPQNRYLPPSVRSFYEWSKSVLNHPGNS